MSNNNNRQRRKDPLIWAASLSGVRTRFRKDYFYIHLLLDHTGEILKNSMISSLFTDWHFNQKVRRPGSPRGALHYADNISLFFFFFENISV